MKPLSSLRALGLAAGLVAPALIAQALPASAAPAPAVKATDPWCRAAPRGALAGACYVALTARADDRLTAVETSASARAEIHTMSIEGGIMRMRRLADGLPLPAGRTVALDPGGAHLMIIGPKRPMAAGTTLDLTLRFAKGPPLRLRAPVRAQDGMSHEEHRR